MHSFAPSLLDASAPAGARVRATAYACYYAPGTGPM